MQTSLVNFVDMLRDDLKFVGVHERALDSFHLLKQSILREDPTQFHLTERYLEVTQKALDEQKAVFKALRDHELWCARRLPC